MSPAEPQFRGVVGRTYRESTAAFPAEPSPPPGAPNVVIVLLDDVGFAQLGCYGSDIATPAMDRLAAGGVRYANFHTTAMCSPTRAALLTGRNHHSVGMGIISEWSTGLPAYQGRVTKRAGLLSEMLREHGYNSFAVGKWHLMPMSHATAAGPFDYWPLQRGFDRYYGFLAGLTDQWHPELHEGNQAVDTPERPGYHLSEDLVDRSIQYLRDQQSAAPGKPFFLYLAFGAGHSPHHAPPEYIERYRGRYDRGWDVAREEYFGRQKAMGLIPADTELAPRDPRVPAWSELSDDEREVCARFQEVFAGFLEHTDTQIGRLIDELERLGQLENTLFILTSDNGASDEGGPFGQLNLRKHSAGIPETIEDVKRGLDLLGSEYTYNHYPRGWANVGNTPLKWYKMDTYGGGVRDPLIVHWPAGVVERGAIRQQYHHVVDIVPTVLEAVGIEPPTSLSGIEQMVIHGVSMLYSLKDGAAPTRKQTQYYELLGDRGIWHQGWKAVTRHLKGEDFEQDRWELYHLDSDFSECRDLSAEQPEKLRELIERWWAEAGRYGALPLDDRDWERLAITLSRSHRERYVYQQGMARIDRLCSPNVANRSWSIEAEVDAPPGVEGVIFAAGGRFGGYVLYVKDGRLTFEYNFANDTRYVITANRPVPEGRSVLRFELAKTGEHRGIGSLSMDGRRVGAVEIPRTFPSIPNTQGIHCGRDEGSPVSEAYRCPFAFTGRIAQVVLELGDDQVRDVEAELREARAEE
jgi:arylsulfatase